MSVMIIGTEGCCGWLLSGDFGLFWLGQTISNLGSSFTLFALPLLVFKLTGSPLNLGVTMAMEFVPYLLFGLVIGAWVDRVDRKRLMIATDLGRAAVISVIPLLDATGQLSVGAVSSKKICHATLTIAFDAGQFAAIPSLVPSGDDLVTANGRVQASYSGAQIAGPLLAGLLVSVMPVQDVLLFDAASFLVSAGTLLLIGTSFNAPRPDGEERRAIRHEVAEGLRYVLGHPVLRNISAMMALINLVGATTYAQLVLFAKRQFAASDVQVAVPLWAAISGLGLFFNINTMSLRQQIVPNHLLGRVISIAGVLAWSAIPLGALLGGWAIERTGSVALVYGVIGGTVALIALAFSFGPLGHAERYLPAAEQQEEEGAGKP